MDIAQLVISILGFVSWLGFAGMVLLEAQLLQMMALGVTQAAPMFAMGLAFLCLAAVALISIVTSANAYSRKPQPRSLTGSMPWLRYVITAYPIILLAGALVIGREKVPDVIPALLTILAILVPAVWLLRMGAGDGWGANPKRYSGLITLTASLTTGFILLVETMVVLIGLGFLVAYLLADPEYLQIMREFIQGAATDPNNIEALLENLSPLAQAPGVSLALVLIMAVVIPVVEELFKTLGVWLLAGRGITPLQGFTAGIMCGAGFAMFEGLLNSIQVLTSPDRVSWLYFTISRSGATLLHIFNGGLIGWALAATWRDRKVGRTVLAYLAAIALHGLWNGLVVVSGLLTMRNPDTSSSWLYLLLGVITLTVLWLFFKLRHKAAADSVLRTQPAEHSLAPLI